MHTFTIQRQGTTSLKNHRFRVLNDVSLREIDKLAASPA